LRRGGEHAADNEMLSRSRRHASSLTAAPAAFMFDAKHIEQSSVEPRKFGSKSTLILRRDIM
jgi:hypothetical protein